MRNIVKKTTLVSSLVLTLSANSMYAQSLEWISSTEGNTWQKSKAKLQTNAAQTPILDVSGSEKGTVFKAWVTCFNELGWDALNMLPKLFSPEGELRFTMGRFFMNANDYARQKVSSVSTQNISLLP